MYRRIQQIEYYVVIANQQCWHANKTWNLYSSNAGIQGIVRKQPVQNIHTQHAYIPLINGLIVQSNLYLPNTHIWLLSASVSQNCAYIYIHVYWNRQENLHTVIIQRNTIMVKSTNWWEQDTHIYFWLSFFWHRSHQIIYIYLGESNSGILHFIKT